MCHGQGCRVFWGMGKILPLMGILVMGPYKPLRIWVEFPIPYGNVMGVDRPDRTHKRLQTKRPRCQHQT